MGDKAISIGAQKKNIDYWRNINDNNNNVNRTKD